MYGYSFRFTWVLIVNSNLCSDRLSHLLPVAVRHFLRSYVKLMVSVFAVILFLVAAQTGCTHGKISKLPTTRAAFRPLAVVITIVPESHTMTTQTLRSICLYLRLTVPHALSILKVVWGVFNICNLYPN